VATGWHELALPAYGVEHLDPGIVEGGVLTGPRAPRVDGADLRLALRGIENQEAVLVVLAVAHQLFREVRFAERIGDIHERDILEGRLLQRLEAAALLPGQRIGITRPL